MKKTFVLLIMMALLGIGEANAQKIASGKHVYTYYMSETETLKEAEDNAVKQAKLSMIADYFGTYVESSTMLQIEETVRSVTYGQIDVKGEWLADIHPPRIVKKVVDDHFALEVTVHCRIREYVSTPIDIHCQVLKNGTDARFASCDFRNGDRMYLSFKSPCDGYLAVYMNDGKDVFCLFPYNGLSADIMKIKADSDYILFSKLIPGDIDPAGVQEYPLGCSPGKQMETLNIYVLFSPNKFVKANDYPNGPQHRSLPWKEFNEWSSKVRTRDSEMNLLQYSVTISGN